MRSPLLGALPCLLLAQAAAQSPLRFQDIQARALPAPEQARAEALLAEHRLQSQESRGLLREGPSLALLAGPRRNPLSGTSTDLGLELDLPLFLSPATRKALESSLGAAHPLLLEAARREGGFRLRKAYLDAWMAARRLALGESDLATVERWLQTARVRLEAGADPAFQVALVEAERLKVLQDLDEARSEAAHSWAALSALAELPEAPVPLAEPGLLPELDRSNPAARLQQGPIRKALLAQAELEAQGLRLKEAQALSRWSLRGSHAREGEETVTRLGLALRLPRAGEGAALRSGTEARLRSLQIEARQALAALDARAAAALQRLSQSPGEALLPDFSRALEAVGLRLEEGRDRPSEALPIRRQLIEAQRASLRRIHAQHLLMAELQALLPEVAP